jgi:hypothetical protein
VPKNFHLKHTSEFGNTLNFLVIYENFLFFSYVSKRKSSYYPFSNNIMLYFNFIDVLFVKAFRNMMKRKKYIPLDPDIKISFVNNLLKRGSVYINNNKYLSHSWTSIIVCHSKSGYRDLEQIFFQTMHSKHEPCTTHCKQRSVVVKTISEFLPG